MNIDAYINHIHSGLWKLQELVCNINDIIENRIEKNLKVVSKTLLVDLPENASFTVSEFVLMQQAHIAARSGMLRGKNIEIEHAVDDLVSKIASYRFEPSSQEGGGVDERDASKLRLHYNHFMYQALLQSAKNSMNALKKRIGSRRTRGTNILNASKPFFEVDVQLMPPPRVAVPVAGRDTGVHQPVRPGRTVVLQDRRGLGVRGPAGGEEGQSYLL